MDFSIYDAVKAGFEKVVFIIKKENASAETVKEAFCMDVRAPGKFVIPGPGMEIELSLREDYENEEIPINRYTKWFDYDKINSKLTIRNPRPGDFFVLDDKGHKKKLSRYYMDEKIAKERRDRQLVLADGSHVIWAVPNRISAACKINQNTKYVLVVTKERIRHERRNQRLD